MKSEHRHELKSNELADWLSNLPQWAKENLSSIIMVVAIIVIFASYFGWKSISTNVKSTEHEEFTTMVDDVLGLKAQIVNQQMSRQGSDMSYILLNKASDLERYAGTTSDKNIAALSLVKAGDSIRSELQYRNEIVSEKELVEEINKAKKDYTEAIAKKPSDKTIEGLAEFGLGLCAEELNNFEEARKIYSAILGDPGYAGTILISKAKLRLEIMDDYKNNIVFQNAPAQPIPEPNSVLDPIIKQLRNATNNFSDVNSASNVGSSDANSSSPVIESVLPVETNLPAVIDSTSDINNPEQ